MFHIGSYHVALLEMLNFNFEVYILILKEFFFGADIPYIFGSNRLTNQVNFEPMVVLWQWLHVSQIHLSIEMWTVGTCHINQP